MKALIFWDNVNLFFSMHGVKFRHFCTQTGEGYAALMKSKSRGVMPKMNVAIKLSQYMGCTLDELISEDYGERLKKQDIKNKIIEHEAELERLRKELEE